MILVINQLNAQILLL